MQSLRADPIAASQSFERLQPAPLSRVFWMSNDAFLDYTFQLTSKAASRFGRNEVLCFTAAHAKGVIQIGTDPTDRRHAILSLASPDGKICVGFRADLQGPSTDNIGPTLNHIAGSFQFTIDADPTPQEIARRIAAQGITRRSATQPTPKHLTTRPD